jgi:hypothetical protein
MDKLFTVLFCHVCSLIVHSINTKKFIASTYKSEVVENLLWIEDSSEYSVPNSSAHSGE